MEDRVDRAPRERMAHVIGVPVVDLDGVGLGVVVGRIMSGTTIDLLVRRRRLFHRSRYMRLRGAAITVSGGGLVYDRHVVPASVRLEVVGPGLPDRDRKGDAA